jgi:hypothetical protein
MYTGPYTRAERELMPMPSATVRIKPQSHQALRELARTSGESLQDVLERAIEEYRRSRILDQVNACYAKLRADPKRWREELEERALSENTLMDGLGDE